MGSYVELTDILRDVVQFLECLREAKLPVNLERVRDSLLTRSKVTLKTFVVDKAERGASPEPYLNMSAGSKGLTSLETELQEYVGAEEHCQMQKEHKESQQDYYETFQGTEPPINADGQSKEEETESMLMNVYSSFSAALVKSKCQICGSLYRKEGKKLFVFEQYRACWVALVGSHLLIYGNDRDNRPYTVLPIRGYLARAAPNAIPRDQRRSESTFEIFRPGSRTYQFSAKTQKEMEQWITRICELAGEGKSEQKKDVDKIATSNDANSREDANCVEEQYQDVGSLSVEKAKPNEPSTVRVNENVSNQTDSKDPVNSSLPPSSPVSCDSGIASPPRLRPPRPHAPPLPARIPRRLPSLPVQKSTSYQFPEEDEDDIYHKIEDFRNATIQYENVGGAKTNEPETYDKKKNVAKRTSTDSSNEVTYDDTANTVSNRADEQDQLASYDDVESAKEKSNKIQTSSKTDEPVKSPQKRSFLDRVRSRRESPKKVEKKTKRKTAQPAHPSLVENQETQPIFYDDVSDLTSVRQETCPEEEQPEYTCPPPPRPVYAKPPVITDATDGQEFYDDVAALRKERERSKNPDQKVSRKPNFQDPVHADADRLAVNESADNSRMEDNEHYKTPRIDYPQCLPELENELYDDIAILADFTARQKEALGKKDGEGVNENSEKRSWNRFVSGRRSKPTDATVETNNKIVNGVEDSVDSLEQHGPTRMNTFQKLISRMESLGKASARTGSSMLSTNKTNLTNNA